MQIRDVMTRNVKTVTPETSLKDACALFLEHRISGLPVVEDGRLVGVLSETDIVAKETSGYSNGEVSAAEASHLRRERRASTVGGAMTPDPITIEPWVSIWAAADVMVVNDVNRLFAVGLDGELLGIVSRDDLVRAFARSDRDVERDIREHLIPSVGLADEELDVRVEKGIVTVSGEIDSEIAGSCLHASIHLVPGVVRVEWHVKHPETATA